MSASALPGLDDFNWTTAAIADACVRLHLPVRLGPTALRPLVPAARIAGAVSPVVHAGSPDVILEAIARSGRGDVLVLDNNGRTDEACLDGLIAAEARLQGLLGIVLDGAHRETARVREAGLPIWSRGPSPVAPQELRRRHTTALQAATCGSVTVTREDGAFADEDGVVFVALADCARVVAAARESVAREQARLARLRDGQALRDQLRLAEYLERHAANPEFTFQQHLDAIDRL